MHTRVLEFLDSNNSLFESQYGFRPGMSCEHALLNAQNKILHSLNNEKISLLPCLHKVGSCVAWLHEMFMDSNEIFCEIWDFTKKFTWKFQISFVKTVRITQSNLTHQFSKPSLKLASITTKLLLGHLCTKIFKNLACSGHLLHHDTCNFLSNRKVFVLISSLKNCLRVKPSLPNRF